MSINFTIPEDGIFSPVQAKELFQHLAAMPDVAHDYFPNGCYARAHLMCHEIQGMGVIPEKAWVKREHDNLRVRPYGWQPFGWDYHVAPVVKVKTNQGIEDIILDPGLFDGPVDIEEWASVMQAKPRDVTLTMLGADSPAGGEAGYFYERKLPKEGAEQNAKMIMQDHFRNKLPAFVIKLPRFNSKWARRFEPDILASTMSADLTQQSPIQGVNKDNDSTCRNVYRRGPPSSKGPQNR